MSKITIEPGTGFDKQFFDGVLTSGGAEFIKRFNARKQNIIKNIGGFLVSRFRQTEVARSLIGNGSVDLPAHFGLNDSQANSLVDNMANIIRKSVRAITVSNENIEINIVAIKEDFQDFLSLPFASIISQPSNITIPIMKWMLIDPNIDIGAAAYSILFDGQGPPRLFKNSRSGRAVMVELGKLGGNTPYVLPSILSQQSGKNFIESSLATQDTLNIIINIIRKNLL